MAPICHTHQLLGVDAPSWLISREQRTVADAKSERDVSPRGPGPYTPAGGQGVNTDVPHFWGTALRHVPHRLLDSHQQNGTPVPTAITPFAVG